MTHQRERSTRSFFNSTIFMEVDFNKLRIENFRPELAKEILDIYIESYKELYNYESVDSVVRRELRIYGRDYPYLNTENLVKCAKDWLNVLVCKYNNKVIAFVSFVFWSEGVAYIDEFHVKKEYRRRGIGSWFLRKVEDLLKSKGVKK